MVQTEEKLFHHEKKTVGKTRGIVEMDMFIDAGRVSKNILASQILTKSNRSTTKIIKELKSIYTQLENRWKAYLDYQEYSKNSALFLREPVFKDEMGKLCKGKKALYPCPVVNEALDRLVTISIYLYSKEKESTLMNRIQKDPETKKMVDGLRQIAIHAEASMEKDALDLIFKSVAKNPNTYTRIVDSLGERVLLKEPKLHQKAALLKALVVEFPKENQKLEPSLFQGLVFKYFDNYLNLVDSELKLLKRDLSEKNDYILQEFSQKTFTFVGAGFPLTGIILHQRTGASVNLIDCDEEAVENAKRFLVYCEKCNIIKKDFIKVIHKNALDIQFFSKNNDNSGVDLRGNSKRILKTDILDLASAIPAEVTDEILKKNVHQNVLIRKRNVQGMSKLLYERYELKEDSSYDLVAEVTTPQDALTRGNLKKVVGITHHDNVNSCELYLRKKEPILTI
jgi:hypothetical protein